MAFWHTRKQLVARNSIDFLPPQRFIKATQLEATSLNFIESAAGTVVSAPDINSSTMMGFPILAVGDVLSTLWRVPADCELNGQLYDIWIYPYAFVAATAESGDTSAWTAQYKALNGSTDTLVVPATATGVTAGALAWEADSGLTRAQTGIKLDLSAATTIVDGTTKFIALNIECDAVTTMVATELTFMGADIVYNVPQT